MINRRFLTTSELSRPSNCPELPLVLEPRKKSGLADLRGFVSDRSDEIRSDLLNYGGILFRGFDLEDAESFASAIEAMGYDPVGENPMDTSPRHSVADRVFTSTDTPDCFPILAHNENCFLHERPKMISFFCQTEPPKYGETPIFDSRIGYEQLPDKVRNKLIGRKVQYRRRFPRKRKPWAPNIVRTWSEAFGTEDREQIEAMTARSGMTCRWHPDGKLLHTEIVIDPLPLHPDTRQRCLNLQGYHSSSILRDIDEVRSRQNRLRNSILKLGARMMYRIEAMPVTIHWGDGSDISHEDMIEIRRATWNNSVVFRWKKGDLLLLDNFLSGHGRMNVVQPRKILAAFGDLITIP